MHFTACLGNADIIQPGLIQLQPNFDDFLMDTLEPLPSLQGKLGTSVWSFFSLFTNRLKVGIACSFLLALVPIIYAHFFFKKNTLWWSDRSPLILTSAQPFFGDPGLDFSWCHPRPPNGVIPKEFLLHFLPLCPAYYLLRLITLRMIW